jgi:uncharacterized protein YcbK (DUF882 family)
LLYHIFEILNDLNALVTVCVDYKMREMKMVDNRKLEKRMHLKNTFKKDRQITLVSPGMDGRIGGSANKRENVIKNRLLDE